MFSKRFNDNLFFNLFYTNNFDEFGDFLRILFIGKGIYNFHVCWIYEIAIES